MLALFVGVRKAAAQGTHFFRIAGPTATTITKFRGDGTLLWINTTPGATYTVQTATSIADGGNWVDYVQLPVTQSVNTNLLVAMSPPKEWRSYRLVPSRLGTLWMAMRSLCPLTSRYRHFTWT